MRASILLLVTTITSTHAQSTTPTINPSAYESMSIPCLSSNECYPKIRSESPPSHTGVPMCSCYANSNIFTFSYDECEGSTNCRIAKCAADACEGLDAYCAGEGDGGYCSLRTTPTLIEAPPVEPTTPSVTGEVELNPCMVGQCLSPNGVCASEVACFVDPCDVSDDCDGECEANYCGGCHAVCLNSTSSTTPNDGSNANVGPSDPTPTTPEAADYTWDGPRCTTDDDCFPKTRERVPGESETIGVTTCQCYPNSRINPLDECQGESDLTCPIAGCMENPCANARAYCLVETGMCYLDVAVEPPSIVMPTVTSGAIHNNNTPANVDPTSSSISTDEVESTYTWNSSCKSDDDCYPAMRQYEPGDSETIGVGVCSCYANSFADPLDECQGDALCIAAMCMDDACEDSAAFCSARGVCELSTQSNLSDATTINSIATILTVATSVATMSAAPGIAIDETSSNEISEGLTDASKPAFVIMTMPTESTTLTASAMNETANTGVDESTDFVADGTSSSVATSAPVDRGTTSTTASDAIGVTTTAADGITENEESGGKQNETAAQSSPRPGNETSEEIQLSTISTVTTTPTESATNEASDQNQTETSSTSFVIRIDEAALSENMKPNETAPNEIDKSQEGIPRPSSAATKNVFSMSVGFVILSWFL